MDDLTYSYDSGNKLLKVSDAIVTATGVTGEFKDDHNSTSTDPSNDYTYDVNGNMLSDTNKSITNISYNHLNLPTSVSINGSAGVGTISYIYDASGTKLEKSVTEGSSVTKTKYAGNYVYKKTGTGAETLEFFNHAEGYIDASGSGFEYVYQYKDHLGNVRLSYKKDASVSSISVHDDFTNNTSSWSHPTSSGAGINNNNEKLNLTLSGRWTSTSKYMSIIPNVPLRIEFDFEPGDMDITTFFVKERINGIWENNSNRDYITNLGDNHYVLDLTLTGDYVQLYFEKGNAADNGTATTCYIDNFKVTQNGLDILEENNYYAFGLKHKGYNDIPGSTNLALKYKFGGKELSEELGLNMYDFGARNYMPDLGRWSNLDPLAEAAGQIHNSPFAYALNNPVVFEDPDGKCPPGVNCLPVSVDSSLNGISGSTNTNVVRIGNSIDVSTSVTVGNVTKTSSPIKLALGSKVKQSHVTDHSAKVIAKNLDASGNGEAKITSGYRDPKDQARVMYNNIEKKGAANQKRLYGKNGDKVIDVHTESKAINKAVGAINSVTNSIIGRDVLEPLSSEAIKGRMTDKINELGPGNVSAHSSDPQKYNVIDISPRSLTNGKAFGKSLKNDPSVNKVITPPKDPAYHVEIKQK